ncbi:MAG: hypothetical protein K2J00_02115 [Bacteroidaceae bacterium]|nr:hypothetical protein [Bacteroidaceae bacterium]
MKKIPFYIAVLYCICLHLYLKQQHLISAFEQKTPIFSQNIEALTLEEEKAGYERRISTLTENIRYVINPETGKDSAVLNGYIHDVECKGFGNLNCNSFSDFHDKDEPNKCKFTWL